MDTHNMTKNSKTNFPFLESYALIQNILTTGLDPQLQLCNVKNVEDSSKSQYMKIC